MFGESSFFGLPSRGTDFTSPGLSKRTSSSVAPGIFSLGLRVQTSAFSDPVSSGALERGIEFKLSGF